MENNERWKLIIQILKRNFAVAKPIPLIHGILLSFNNLTWDEPTEVEMKALEARGSPRAPVDGKHSAADVQASCSGVQVRSDRVL